MLPKSDRWNVLHKFWEGGAVQQLKKKGEILLNKQNVNRILKNSCHKFDFQKGQTRSSYWFYWIHNVQNVTSAISSSPSKTATRPSFSSLAIGVCLQGWFGVPFFPGVLIPTWGFVPFLGYLHGWKKVHRICSHWQTWFEREDRELMYEIVTLEMSEN